MTELIRVAGRWRGFQTEALDRIKQAGLKGQVMLSLESTGARLLPGRWALALRRAASKNPFLEVMTEIDAILGDDIRRASTEDDVFCTQCADRSGATVPKETARHLAS